MMLIKKKYIARFTFPKSLDFTCLFECLLKDQSASNLLISLSYYNCAAILTLVFDAVVFPCCLFSVKVIHIYMQILCWIIQQHLEGIKIRSLLYSGYWFVLKLVLLKKKLGIFLILYCFVLNWLQMHYLNCMVLTIDTYACFFFLLVYLNQDN